MAPPSVDGIPLNPLIIIVPTLMFLAFLIYWLGGYTKRTCGYCGHSVRERDASKDTRVPVNIYCHKGLCTEKYLRRAGR